MNTQPFGPVDAGRRAETASFALPMEAGPAITPTRRLMALGAALVMLCAAAVISVSAERLWGWNAGIAESLTPFVGLLVLGAIGDGLRERSRVDQVELSFTAMILLGAIPLTGPVPATVLGPLIMLFSPIVSGVVRRVRGTAALPPRTFVTFAVNASMTALLTATGALTYCLADSARVAGGGWTPRHLFLEVGWPLLLADLSFILVNALLVSAFIALTARSSLRTFIGGALPVSILLYLGYGVTAFIFVVLWGPIGLGPLALVLVLAPLLMSRWAYLEYVEEREVHHRLLHALAGTGELRGGTLDRPYRLTRTCEALAAELGLSGRDHDILREAAALHDVGIVSVPWALLDKDPAELSEDELARIAAHTRVSHDVLSGIDFVEDSAEAVLHHHERYDGRGYPNRLAGGEIPRVSRVLAAADLAEAVGRDLPNTPVGRQELVNQLRRCSGTILDPVVVNAFVKVLQSSRRAQLFTDLLQREVSGSCAHRAHARPQMADLIAGRRHGAFGSGSFPVVSPLPQTSAGHGSAGPEPEVNR